jgi:hypothetical protein
MTKTESRRPIPAALTLLVAVFSALVALALSGGHGMNMTAHAATHHAQSATITRSQLALRNDMRRLWEDHVTWTRLAVISLTTDAPDTKTTVARLLRNQTDIGNAIARYYGAPAGKQLTALLRQHILIAADLIAAAKAGDAAAVKTQQARWTANADQIARFLTTANPQSWHFAEMKAMLHDHLRLTTAEVVARLQQNWPADVRAYDRISRQALNMADMFSNGIVRQFPSRFE